MSGASVVPVMRIDEAFSYALPMVTRFRRITVRHGMILRCGGTWREWSPFAEYDDAEAATWLRASLEDSTPEIGRSRIEVNATIPVVDPSSARRLVAESGCRTVKVKVADPRSTIDDDLARLKEVRAELGESGAIRVDANGAWTVEQAKEALAVFAEVGLDYAEQPCATMDDLARLKEWADGRVRIAADESVRRERDLERLKSLGAADVLILKTQPVGGIARCAQIACDFGLPVTISSALETSIGIWRGMLTAASIPGHVLACGLNTVRLFRDDLTDISMIAHDGYLSMDREPQIDLDALACHRSPDDPWWQARLRRCLALLDEESHSIRQANDCLKTAAG